MTQHVVLCGSQKQWNLDWVGKGGQKKDDLFLIMPFPKSFFKGPKSLKDLHFLAIFDLYAILDFYTVKKSQKRSSNFHCILKARVPKSLFLASKKLI